MKSWMHANLLKLNWDKLDIIIIGHKSHTKTTHKFCLTIANSSLSPAPHICNLWVIFNDKLSFKQHFNQITRNGFFHLKKKYSSSRSITLLFLLPKLWSTLSSHPTDYCDSMAHHLKSQTNSSTSKTLLLACSPTPAPLTTSPLSSKNLYWLPVPQKIQFKVLLTQKALHNQAPHSLTDLLHHHTPSHNLCSSDANLLCPPIRTKLQTCGTWAFSIIAAPSFVNSPQTEPITNQNSSFQKSF